MTFAEWYSANVEPGVIQMANTLPDKAAREMTLKAARDSMAACWNAALDSVCHAKFTREEFPPPCGLPAEIPRADNGDACTWNFHSRTNAGEAVTFGQWWIENRDARLIAIPNTDPDDESLRKLLAACWNEALDAACNLRQPHWNKEEITEMLEEFRA